MVRVANAIPVGLTKFSVTNSLDLYIDLFPKQQIGLCSDETKDWETLRRRIRKCGHNVKSKSVLVRLNWAVN
jgi:hypothetical protein